MGVGGVEAICFDADGFWDSFNEAWYLGSFAISTNNNEGVARFTGRLDAQSYSTIQKEIQKRAENKGQGTFHDEGRGMSLVISLSEEDLLKLLSPSYHENGQFYPVAVMNGHAS